MKTEEQTKAGEHKIAESESKARDSDEQSARLTRKTPKKKVAKFRILAVSEEIARAPTSDRNGSGRTSLSVTTVGPTCGYNNKNNDGDNKIYAKNLVPQNLSGLKLGYDGRHEIWPFVGEVHLRDQPDSLRQNVSHAVIPFSQQRLQQITPEGFTRERE